MATITETPSLYRCLASPFCMSPHFSGTHFSILIPLNNYQLRHSTHCCLSVGLSLRNVHSSGHGDSWQSENNSFSGCLYSPFCMSPHVCGTPLSTLQPQHSWILSHSICSFQQGSSHHLREVSFTASGASLLGTNVPSPQLLQQFSAILSW